MEDLHDRIQALEIIVGSLLNEIVELKEGQYNFEAEQKTLSTFQLALYRMKQQNIAAQQASTVQGNTAPFGGIFSGIFK